MMVKLDAASAWRFQNISTQTMQTKRWLNCIDEDFGDLPRRWDPWWYGSHGKLIGRGSPTRWTSLKNLCNTAMPSMSPASNHGALAIPPSGFKRWATRMLCRNVAERNYQQISWHAVGLFWYFFWIRLKQYLRLNRSNLWMRNGHHDQSWPVYGWSADRHTHTNTHLLPGTLRTQQRCQVVNGMQRLVRPLRRCHQAGIKGTHDI